MRKVGKKLIDFASYSLPEDEDEYGDYYNDTMYTLGDIFHRKFPNHCVKVRGENINWRNQSATAYLHVSGDEDQLDEIAEELLYMLVSTCERTFDAFNYGNGLFIRIYHHDCPTGSLFYLTPIASSTYLRHKR